jgi:hypothetical protein
MHACMEGSEKREKGSVRLAFLSVQRGGVIVRWGKQTVQFPPDLQADFR